MIIKGLGLEIGKPKRPCKTGNGNVTDMVMYFFFAVPDCLARRTENQFG